MGAVIYCLVDSTGRTSLNYADSLAGAEGFGAVSETGYATCGFDLTTRRLFPDGGDPDARSQARAWLNGCVGTPERLMAFAEEGTLPKHVLAQLLTASGRIQYLEACAEIEKRYTAACASRNDPCLEPGCAMEKEEACLQPLLRAETEYHQACGAEWVRWFSDPQHRIEPWKA